MNTQTQKVTNYMMAAYFAVKTNRYIKIAGETVVSDAYLQWLNNQACEIAARPIEPKPINPANIQPKRLDPVAAPTDDDVATVGVRAEVSEATFTDTMRFTAPSVKAPVKLQETKQPVVEAKAPRGLKRLPNESVLDWNNRVVEHNAHLAAQRRARYARLHGSVVASVRKAVDTHGIESAPVALAVAMTQLPTRTSVKTREDILAILTERFQNPAKPQGARRGEAQFKGETLIAATRAEEYRKLQTGWWRRDNGHGERMTCSKSNPMYHVTSTERTAGEHHTENFGAQAFEPSGTRGELMQSIMQRTPVRSRVFDRNGILEGQYTSIADEMHWSNAYDRLTSPHPQPLPDKLFTQGPVASPFTAPTPQGHGAFSPWPCAEVNS